MKIERRPTIAMLMTAMIAAATGCGGTTDEPVTPAGATRAPVAMKADDRLRRVGAALGEVALLPAQRAEIDKLAIDADARHEKLSHIRQELVARVALQVEAGAIDRSALQPKLDELATAWGKTRSADAAAVERLHAILDADQRADLVDALRDSREGGRRSKGERLVMLADELSLTADQMAKIRETLEQRRAERRLDKKKDGARRGKHRFEGMLEAFETDEFSLDHVPGADELRDKALRRAERMLGTIEAVLPILTAEQRKLAAAKLNAFARDAMP